MKKKISAFLFAVCAFVPCSLMLTGCGENVTLTDISVDVLNNTFVVENNTVTVEWSEDLNISNSDFKVTAKFSDKSEKVIDKNTQEVSGYTFESTLPTEGAIPAGEYTLTFTYNGKTETININVVKKVVSLSNLTWTDSSNFVYDGTEKTVEITSTLPEYVTVSYKNNKKTKAGTYQAVATFTCTNPNYALSTSTATFNWEIADKLEDIQIYGNNYLVWLYTKNGDEIEITPVVDGVYVRKCYLSEAQEIVPLNVSMISYDEDEAKNAILDLENEYDFAMVDFVITIEDKTDECQAVLITQEQISTLAPMASKRVYKDGEQVYGNIKVKQNSNFDDCEFFMGYTYYGYTYFEPINYSDVIDITTSATVDLSVLGTHNVNINGYECELFVYSLEGADISFDLDNSLTVKAGLTLEEFKELLLNEQMNLSVFVKVDDHYEYLLYKQFKFKEENFGDLSTLDLNRVCSTSVEVVYGEYTGRLQFTINPNLDGQTPVEYKFVEDDTQVVRVYDEYVAIKSWGDNYSYYTYQIIDEENHIVKVDYEMGKLIVINETDKTYNMFKGEMLLNAEEKEYVLNMGGKPMIIKVYNDKYADTYSYNKDNQLEYNSTVIVEKFEKDGNNYYTVMELTYLIDDVNHTLIIQIAGTTIYTFEVERSNFVAQRFVFNEDNGEKIAYYYMRQNASDELELYTSLEWRYTANNTKIIGTFQGEDVFEFTIENNQITGYSYLVD